MKRQRHQKRLLTLGKILSTFTLLSSVFSCVFLFGRGANPVAVSSVQFSSALQSTLSPLLSSPPVAVLLYVCVRQTRLSLPLWMKYIIARSLHSRLA